MNEDALKMHERLFDEFGYGDVFEDIRLKLVVALNDNEFSKNFNENSVRIALETIKDEKLNYFTFERFYDELLPF